MTARKAIIAICAGVAAVAVVLLIMKLRKVWDHAERFDRFCFQVRSVLRDDQERLLDPKERDFVLKNFWHYGRWDGAEPLARCQANPISDDRYLACKASGEIQCYVDLAKEVEANLIAPL